MARHMLMTMKTCDDRPWRSVPCSNSLTRAHLAVSSSDARAPAGGSKVEGFYVRSISGFYKGSKNP